MGTSPKFLSSTWYLIFNCGTHALMYRQKQGTDSVIILLMWKNKMSLWWKLNQYYFFFEVNVVKNWMDWTLIVNFPAKIFTDLDFTKWNLFFILSQCIYKFIIKSFMKINTFFCSLSWIRLEGSLEVLFIYQKWFLLNDTNVFIYNDKCMGFCHLLVCKIRYLIAFGCFVLKRDFFVSLLTCNYENEDN